MLSIGDAVVIFPNQISMNISLLNLLIMRFIITFPMYKVLVRIPDREVFQQCIVDLRGHLELLGRVSVVLFWEIVQDY